MTWRRKTSLLVPFVICFWRRMNSAVEVECLSDETCLLVFLVLLVLLVLDERFRSHYRYILWWRGDYLLFINFATDCLFCQLTQKRGFHEEVHQKRTRSSSTKTITTLELQFWGCSSPLVFFLLYSLLESLGWQALQSFELEWKSCLEVSEAYDFLMHY